MLLLSIYRVLLLLAVLNIMDRDSCCSKILTRMSWKHFTLWNIFHIRQNHEVWRYLLLKADQGVSNRFDKVWIWESCRYGWANRQMCFVAAFIADSSRKIAWKVYLRPCRLEAFTQMGDVSVTRSTSRSTPDDRFSNPSNWGCSALWRVT